jgi:S1-C subfamily serine protease
LSGEGLNVQGRFVLRVTAVERGRPAQKAGLEPGDVIVAVNDRELKDAGQLDEIVGKGGPLNLVVVDINSGKAARVVVDLAGAGAPGVNPPVVASPTQPDQTSSPAPAGSRRSLGISAEPVTLGQRTAMKVVGVEPGSPGQKAGLEPGDVIVAANGAPVTGIEQLGAALRKSGPTLRLVIRDTRTGRDIPVDVQLGGPAVAEPAPIPQDAQPRAGAGRGLGAVTELFFLDTDAAVKVSEVEPNSPAARAGLKPGDVIIQANDTPVLHPNTLNEVVAKSGPTLKLIVIDPRSGRKSNLDVNLGGVR